MAKFKLVYNATTGEADEVKSFLHSSTSALSSTGTYLDVQIQNTSIAVTATDLDIRDLAFATDSVDVSGSAVSITGTVAVTQSTSPWVVSATNLDIRDLVFASDKVDVSGSSVSISGTVSTTMAPPSTLSTLSKAVTTTSSLLYTSPAGQVKVLIQNNGNQPIAVGPSGVTYSGTPSTDGYIIAAGDAQPFEISDGTAIHAVAKGGTQDVRVCKLVA